MNDGDGMKRNWDKIREILIKIEGRSPKSNPLKLSDFPQDEAYEYSYHIELLIEADLLHGEMVKTFGRHAQDFFVNRLTWEGHEFLEAIRSESVWDKTKKSFVKGGLSMTFDLIKGVATDIAASLLKTTISS